MADRTLQLADALGRGGPHEDNEAITILEDEFEAAIGAVNTLQRLWLIARRKNLAIGLLWKVGIKE
jgi:hypothetical protein